jgi:quinol monooxygenase YgiN
LSSERFSVSSVGEILETWTMEDVIDAHLVLDMFQELEQKARSSQG